MLTRLGKMLTGALMFSVLVAGALVVNQGHSQAHDVNNVWATARDTTVKISYLLNDGPRMVGTGTMMGHSVVTAAHVCEYIETTTYKAAVVHFVDGYRTSMSIERHPDADVFDVCVLAPRWFKGVKERWNPVTEVGVVGYGGTVHAVTMYNEEGWMTYGVVGSDGCSKVPGNSNAGQISYLPVGGGSSGSGLFDTSGNYVGMLIQSKQMSVGMFGRKVLPMGYTFFIPGVWVRDYLQNGTVRRVEQCAAAAE